MSEGLLCPTLLLTPKNQPIMLYYMKLFQLLCVSLRPSLQYYVCTFHNQPKLGQGSES